MAKVGLAMATVFGGLMVELNEVLGLILGRVAVGELVAFGAELLLQVWALDQSNALSGKVLGVILGMKAVFVVLG